MDHEGCEEVGFQGYSKSPAENITSGSPSEEDERLAENSVTVGEERRNRARHLKEHGNEMFKKGQYQEALEMYTAALLHLCTLDATKERSILYSNRAAARSRLDQKEEAIEDCTKAIEFDPSYIKPILRRAHLYEDTDKLDEALTDYKRILELDPRIHEARHACVVLPQKMNERNERLKTEMLGKLKELGNLVLNPFGMSTDNFKLVKNEEGYSVQFQK